MARRLLMLVAVLVGGMVSQPAMADACRDTFIKVMTDQTPKGPTRSRSVTTMSGQKPMISVNHRSANGDWMTEMVEPASSPWSLAIGRALYSSRDKGGTWQKVRDMNDAGHDPAVVLRQLRETAATAANAACSFEIIDQKRLEKIEADVVHASMNIAARHAFWVDPDTGRVLKSWQRLNTSGTIVEIIESITYPAEVELPRPK